MSKSAKICFLAAFLVLIAAFAVQIVTGMWINLNSILLAVACGMVLLAVAFDYKMYVEFLSMRTTKHGMNMGAMILIVLVFVVCINYLANRHNKSWDLTQEKLNSLSEQSEQLAKGLKETVEFKVFTRGESAPEEKQRVRQTLQQYTDVTPQIKVRYINPYVDAALAMEYLNGLPDRDTAPTVVFAEHKGKKIRVDRPFDEAAVTGALIKATRQGEAKIYFIKGHGEKDIDGDSDQSLRELARTLTESSFIVESLNLIDRKEIPKDAAVVAIVGPAMPYLESELQWLRDYVKQGGRILIALDPGQRHGLANLTKTLGVEFQNNYVITTQPVVGGGPAMILGRTFDLASGITRSFPQGSSISLFYLTSEVTSAPGKPDSIVVSELVKSDASAFTVVDVRKPLAEKPQGKVVTLAVVASGTVEPDSKAFEAVVFGDSDFMINRSLLAGINKDLALNAFAELANQKDLLSIRPKLPKGSTLILTRYSSLGLLMFTIALPLFLLITSGVVWFRRRGA